MRRNRMFAVFIMILEPCTRAEEFASGQTEFLSLALYEIAQEPLDLVRIFDVLECDGMVALIGSI